LIVVAPPLRRSPIPNVKVAHSPTPSAVRMAARSVGAVRKAAAAWDWWCSVKNIFSGGVPRCEVIRPRTHILLPIEFFMAWGNDFHEVGNARKTVVRMRSNLSMGRS
jgi:hypothetical protein